MKSILRNTLAIIAGILIGGGLNMLIILVSKYIISPPEGADVTSMEGLKASMHLFQPKNFIMPFLAHALGTLLGAYITALIADKKKMIFAFVIGCWFLLGGIMNIFMLPSPLWFSFVDLAGAYLPMAYLASILAIKKN